MVIKEIHELRRDKVSISMVLLTPLFQLIILGYAINMDPHNLPTALLNYDTERMSQIFVTEAQNTGYFSMIPVDSEEAAQKAFVRGDVTFIVTIPEGFTRKLLRGEKPQLLIQGDAIDPITTGNALSALVQVAKSMFQHDLPGDMRVVQKEDDFELIIHRMFNPEGITQFNTIPGIMGSILSTTLILMTALSITRERENGALENLLVSPLSGLEVIIGKITPFVIIGLFQATLILIAAVLLFDIPLHGSVFLLFFVLLIYVFLCLSIGIGISGLAQNQLQALQMSSFYFIPSLMLSGFVSPFISMPDWAKAIGSCLPLTYFIRLVKGIMLKGYSATALLPDLLPLIGLAVIVIGVGLKMQSDEGEINPVDILRWPGVMAAKEQDLDAIAADILAALDGALDDFIVARETEGQALKALIEQRLEGVSGEVAKVRAHMPEILQWQRERLVAKLEDAEVQLENNRLEQELVLMAQRIDVAEELDRLEAHVKETYNILKKKEAVGRRLDFMMQEFNRESNTLASKSINAEVTNSAIELKVLIEQMREQIQNIE